MGTSKAKILYVVHGYHNRAGVEEHVKLLAAGIRNRYQVSICFPESSSIVLMQEGASPVRYPGDLIDLIAPYHAERSEYAFSQILKRVDPDIVHIVHFLNWPLSIIDQAAAFGKPLIVSFHDYYAVTPYYTMQGEGDPHETVSTAYSLRFFESDISDYLRNRRLVLTRSLQQAKSLIVPSVYLKTQLAKVFPYQFEVIENGIRPFTASAARDWPELRFGYVGTLLPQKGWELLLNAFAALQPDYPEAQLHFFGGVVDPCYKLPGVSFHGLYNRSELSRIVSEINVGIIPSLFPETYSLVLSELWQGGVVAAVADIGAMSDRVIDGVNGKKFKAGDLDSLIATLRWFLANDAWRSWQLPQPRLGEAMAADYDSLYQQTLFPENAVPRLVSNQ